MEGSKPIEEHQLRQNSNTNSKSSFHRRPQSARRLSLEGLYKSYDKKQKKDQKMILEVLPGIKPQKIKIQRKKVTLQAQEKPIKHMKLLFAYDQIQFATSLFKKDIISPIEDSQVIHTVAVKNFNCWRKSLKDDYKQVFNKFVTSTNLEQLDQVKQKLQNISALSQTNLERAEMLLQKNYSSSIRSLCEAFKKTVFKSKEFNKAMNILCDGKHFVYSTIKNLHQNKNLKEILSKIPDKKQKQIRDVFSNHFNSKQYQDKIINKVLKSISEIVSSSANKTDEISKIKQTFDQILSYPELDEKSSYYKLEKILDIFLKIVEQQRVFKTQIQCFLSNQDQISSQIRPKILEYCSQLNEKKNRVVLILISTIKQISTVLKNKLQENLKINHVVTEEDLSFKRLKFVFQGVSEALIKQNMEEGNIISHFLKYSFPMISEIKQFYQKLISIKKSIQKSRRKRSSFYENLYSQIKQLKATSMKYKQYLTKIIYNFQNLNQNLTSKNREQKTDTKSPKFKEDDQIKYIDFILEKLSLTIKTKKKITDAKKQLDQLLNNSNQQKNREEDTSPQKRELKIRQKRRFLKGKKKSFKRYLQKLNTEIEQSQSINLIVNVTGELKFYEECVDQMNLILRIMQLIEATDKNNIKENSSTIVGQIRKLEEQSDSKDLMLQYFIYCLGQIVEVQSTKDMLFDLLGKEYLDEKQIQNIINNNEIIPYKSQEPQIVQQQPEKQQEKQLSEKQMTIKSQKQESEEQKSIDNDAELMEQFHLNNNQIYPNIEFIQKICKLMFDAHFKQSNNKTQDSVSKSEDIDIKISQIKQHNLLLANQITNLNSIYQKSRNDSFKTQINLLISQMQALQNSISQFISSQQTSMNEKYRNFLSCSLTIIAETKQNCVCILDSKTSPIFISKVSQDNHLKSVIQILKNFTSFQNSKLFDKIKDRMIQKSFYLRKGGISQFSQMSKSTNFEQSKTNHNSITKQYLSRSLQIGGKKADSEQVQSNKQKILIDLLDGIQQKQSHFIQIQTLDNLEQLVESANNQKIVLQPFSLDDALFKLLTNLSLSHTFNSSKKVLNIQILLNEMIKRRNKINQDLNINFYKDVIQQDQVFINNVSRINKIIDLLQPQKSFSDESLEQLNLLFTLQGRQMCTIVQNNNVVLKIPIKFNPKSIIQNYIQEPMKQIDYTLKSQQIINELMRYFYKQNGNELIRSQELNIEKNKSFKEYMSNTSLFNLSNQSNYFDSSSLKSLFETLMNFHIDRQMFNISQLRLKIEIVSQNIQQLIKKKKIQIQKQSQKYVFKHFENNKIVRSYCGEINNIFQNLIKKLKQNILNLNANNLTQSFIYTLQQLIFSHQFFSHDKSRQIRIFIKGKLQEIEEIKRQHEQMQNQIIRKKVADQIQWLKYNQKYSDVDETDMFENSLHLSDGFDLSNHDIQIFMKTPKNSRGAEVKFINGFSKNSAIKSAKKADTSGKQNPESPFKKQEK